LLPSCVPCPDGAIQNCYNLDLQQVKKDIDSQGIAVIIASNPRNPTGQIIQGKDLKELVDICHESATTVILDEVQSYSYNLENCSLL
jgi:aspartate/methionine/tyrosine aminotransferase